MGSFTELFGKSFDEASFALINSFNNRQNQPDFLTDREGLNRFLELANSQPQDLFAPQPFPVVRQTPLPNPWQINPLGKDYRFIQLNFPSGKPLGYPANDRVQAYYFYRPGFEKGPVLFYLHGWMAASPEWWFRVPLNWAEPLGMNVFFLELPFHMHRAPPGTFSGQLSLSGNLVEGIQGVQQAVSDVRASLAWLKSRGVNWAALAGRSMGGLVAASTLTVEAGFNCAILDIPAVSPHGSIWHSNYTRRVRENLLNQGLSEEGTEELFKIMRPGRFKPRLSPENILLIEATADRACFPQETEVFAREWNLDIVKVPFGHMSIIFSRQAKKSALAFLRKRLPRQINS